ncbi:MAG: hypothetical protein FWC71_12170 [Defluviitaleaceae bacterium]|nr:hypothetical protein [Defluviitaleaceae bacterium]
MNEHDINAVVDAQMQQPQDQAATHAAQGVEFLGDIAIGIGALERSSDATDVVATAEVAVEAATGIAEGAEAVSTIAEIGDAIGTIADVGETIGESTGCIMGFFGIIGSIISFLLP